MKPTRQSVAVLFAAFLLTAVPAAFAQDPARLYDRGQRALDDGRWDAALEAFNQIIQEGGAQVDGALYWAAYSLNKMGRQAEALSILSELHSGFPKSSWLQDARALEMEIRPAAEQAAEEISDEDLKMYAIGALIHADPETAIPLLEEIVADPGRSLKLRERALFVLAQSGTDRARQTLGRIARDDSEPKLQQRALHSLGVFGNGKNRQLLAEVYTSTQRKEVKSAVLRAYMVSGAKQALLDVLSSETDPELRGIAIRQLGLVGAADELKALYAGQSDPETKKQILRALFLGGQKDFLFEVARTEGDPELRKVAIQQLGLAGGADQIAKLYEQEPSLEVKKQMLHAFFLAGAVEFLQQTVEQESNEELRLTAIHKLGLTGGKSRDFLTGLYHGEETIEVRQAVIQALFLQGAAETLVELARAEQDPELKKQIVRKLSLMGSPEATNFLIELLKQP